MVGVPNLGRVEVAAARAGAAARATVCAACPGAAAPSGAAAMATINARAKRTRGARRNTVSSSGVRFVRLEKRPYPFPTNRTLGWVPNRRMDSEDEKGRRDREL